MEGLYILDDINSIFDGRVRESGYYFAICHGGSMSFDYVDRHFLMGKGDAVLFKNGQKGVMDIKVSDDFSCTLIFASYPTIRRFSLGKFASDFKQRAHLFLNPVIRMDAESSARCEAAFADVAVCESMTGRLFYEQVLQLSLSRMLLELSEAHIKCMESDETSGASYDTFSQFIELIEMGNFKKHRLVSWYAEKLGISPKHLSYCARVSGGRSAQYWIDSFCIISIVDELKVKSATQVCEEYGFSSLSYLSRYVKRILGVSPKDVK